MQGAFCCLGMQRDPKMGTFTVGRYAVLLTGDVPTHALFVKAAETVHHEFITPEMCTAQRVIPCLMHQFQRWTTSLQSGVDLAPTCLFI